MDLVSSRSSYVIFMYSQLDTESVDKVIVNSCSCHVVTIGVSTSIAVKTSFSHRITPCSPQSIIVMYLLPSYPFPSTTTMMMPLTALGTNKIASLTSYMKRQSNGLSPATKLEVNKFEMRER